MQTSRDRLLAWIRIARLQFYPPVAVLYGVGALAARGLTGRFDGTLCALGYAYLFLVGLATSISNEYFDQRGDAANANAGPFTGGSRVLVEGRLGSRAVRTAILLVVGAALAVSAALVLRTPAEHRFPIVVLVALGLLLGLGYTVPPLHLSYRGLGELDVALMHSAFVTSLGYAVQAGDWRHPLPYVLSAPSFFAVLSAITLAGLPDHAADTAAGKRSWTVLFGRRTAATTALLAAVAAGVCGLWLWLGGVVGGPLGALFALAAAHALVLAVALIRFIRSGTPEGRIDGLMSNVLIFTLWFGAIPLAHFLLPAP
jgi:1,4-dihydroxy-2-naphthoate octaprenyltransferase